MSKEKNPDGWGESWITDLEDGIAGRDRIIDDLQADRRGMGAWALAQKRAVTITELVDEKIALRRQLEEAQFDRDSYKASFDAADIALTHATQQATELAEQLNYAQATILKQAHRMALLEAELHDLKAGGR